MILIATKFDKIQSWILNIFRPIDDGNAYQTEIEIGQMPTYCFRRQALRTRLDDVVFIGGILGLFLGASILSGLEIIYYFTLRWWNNRLIITKS